MKKVIRHSLAACTLALAANTHADPVAFYADYLNLSLSQQTAAVWASKVSDTSKTGFVYAPHSARFDRGHGFRAGMLVKPSADSWQANFTWTYFPTKAKEGIRENLQIILSDFFSGFNSGNYFFGADVDWELLMHTLDFQLSHDYNISDSFKITPKIGVKGGYIKQTVDADWDALSYIATEHVNHKYFGLGPSFALGSKLNLTHGFSLTGDLLTAYMWGNWNISDTYHRPSALGGIVTETTITTKFNHAQLGTLMLDLMLGAQWERLANPHIALRLGYEMQYWANQLRLPTFQELPTHGSMTLQGVTCGIYIDI